MYVARVSQDSVVFLVLVPLVAFAIYRRLRRTLGRQLFAPRTMKTRMSFLSAVGVFWLVSLPTAAGFGAAVAGSVVGVALGVFGLRHTRFEKTDAGLFFTPNRYIGLGVTALFLGRLAVRLVTAYRMAQAAALSGEPPLAGFQRSALTVAFYFLLAGYYVGYYALVLRAAEARATQ